MATAIEKAEQFYTEYEEKLTKLKNLTKNSLERADYLQLEIRMLNEVAIPRAQTKAVLEGTGNSEVIKLKRQLQKFQDELQEKQEEQVILHHASEQYKVQVADTAAELQKLLKDETDLAENKAYANMMYAKKQYIDAIIQQAKPLQELNSIDAKLQSILVDAGRQKNIYSGIVVKTPLDPQYKAQHDGVYLQLSLQEAKSFILGNYTKDSYDYLHKFANPKNL